MIPVSKPSHSNSQNNPLYSSLYNWLLRQRKSWRTIEADKAQHDGKRVQTSLANNKANNNASSSSGRHWLNDKEIGQLTALGFEWNPSSASSSSATSSSSSSRKKKKYDNNPKQQQQQQQPPPPQKSWMDRYQNLKDYKQEHGHTNVARRDKHHPSLGEWCYKLRQMRRGVKGVKNCLSEGKIGLLDDIGFVWGKVELMTFEKRLEQCLQFRRQHGHLQIPKPMQKRRKEEAYVVSTTTSEHVVTASRASSETEEEDNADNNGIEEVENVASSGEQEGGTNGEADTTKATNSDSHYAKEEQSFYRWAKLMRYEYHRLYKDGDRRQYKSRHLDHRKIQKLKRIGFSFEKLPSELNPEAGTRKSWMERYNDLKKYKEEHGHTRVRRLDEEHRSLGEWCHKMRQMKRGVKGVYNYLNGEKLLLLDDIGFVWEPSKVMELMRHD
jgi:hypothetical protein